MPYDLADYNLRVVDEEIISIQKGRFQKIITLISTRPYSLWSYTGHFLTS